MVIAFAVAVAAQGGNMRVVVAGDLAGVSYKNAIKEQLQNDPRVSEVIDVGVQEGEDIDYPHVAVDAARAIKDGRADRGILICGTGMGVAIAANKVPGIRAATRSEKRRVGIEG